MKGTRLETAKKRQKESEISGINSKKTQRSLHKKRQPLGAASREEKWLSARSKKVDGDEQPGAFSQRSLTGIAKRRNRGGPSFTEGAVKKLHLRKM